MAAAAADTVISAPAEAPNLPGYRCERLLGRGGMGEVWLAQHLALQRHVALKVMRPELAKDTDFAERFLREARAAAKLTHPGVVSVYDAGQINGHLYLAMEYVPGGDLGQFMSNKKASIDQALDLIIRAAEGLQAIHDAGLVHRDLKPDNILIDAQGHPRIADLGLARTQIGDDRMTATGMAMGTPAYMSPEQAQGSPDLDGRSDVYSLAATLFALLAGRPPFSGPTPYVTVAQVLNDPPPNLSTINPKVSIALAAVIAQTLSKQPEKRPASARAFATALQDARHGRIPPTATSLKRWWLIGGAIAAIVVIGIIIGLTSRQPMPRTADAPAASPPTESAPAPSMAKAAPTPTTTTAKAPETTSAPPPKKTSQPFRAFRDSWRELRGALRTSLPSRLSVVHNATIAVVKNHHLTMTKSNGDASSTHIEATLNDGINLTIALSIGDNDSTDVVIQVGKFGDENRSQTVLQWIKDEL